MLPPETEKVWGFLKEQPALREFVLIGGSALALRIGHRLSEDLDFVSPTEMLPRHRLDALGHAAARAGFEFQANDDEAALEEFVLGGLELHDYQQQYLVNRTVKVSFFVADEGLKRVLSRTESGRVRVAELHELFKAKSLVSATRSKTRDWLDLYLLMRDHGFTIRDYHQAFVEAGIPGQCEIGLDRICSGVPHRSDEGYQHLLENPPALEEMVQYFREQRDRLEAGLAAEAARRRRAQGSDASG